MSSASASAYAALRAEELAARFPGLPESVIANMEPTGRGHRRLLSRARSGLGPRVLVRGHVLDAEVLQRAAQAVAVEAELAVAEGRPCGLLLVRARLRCRDSTG